MTTAKCKVCLQQDCECDLTKEQEKYERSLRKHAKVVVVTIHGDELLAHDLCSTKDGVEHEMVEEPTNDNQCEMFCFFCQEPIGYDPDVK